jgi:hypothetical protein
MLSDNLKLFILFIVFLVGAYVTGKGTVGREGFEGADSRISANDDVVEDGGSSGGGSKDLNPLRSRCPNLLIQKGTTLYLHNTNLAPVPGVNPIRFDNLEEYIEFIEWLRGQGIKCPILFLQHSVNAQGESVYNIRPSPTDLRGGLCPSTGHVAGIDADNVDSEMNHDDGMGPGDGAFRLHSINAKASAASSRYDTVVSPQQISEITKLIDQAGENDPYAVSKYPNVFGKGGDATIIRPADRESMLKIQASYLNQQKSG